MHTREWDSKMIGHVEEVGKRLPEMETLWCKQDIEGREGQVGGGVS